MVSLAPSTSTNPGSIAREVSADLIQAAAATVGLIAGRVKRSLGGLTLVAVLVLAMACSAGTLLIRPHLLVLPILIVWLRELLAARDAERAPRWFMPALMALWANLHG